MSIPSAFRHLVDDAAIFPPGRLPLEEAVPAHRDHVGAAHAELVGPFVVDLDRLDLLVRQVADSHQGEVLDVSVVVPAPAEVGTAVRTVAASPGLRLESLEVKTEVDHHDVRFIGDAAPPDVTVFLELPRPAHPRWTELLHTTVDHGWSAKFRTGGLEAQAFPTESEVARWIVAVVEADVPFKCTAGLHRALRHQDAATGFEHHGYLNILLATARARHGADRATVSSVLAETDPESVVTALRNLEHGTLEGARHSFVSYGSCSILEPLEDLTVLGLVPPAVSTPETAVHRGESR